MKHELAKEEKCDDIIKNRKTTEEKKALRV